VERRTRIKLIVAAVVAAVLFIAALAWHERGYPLRYLRPGRVSLARAAAVRSRRSRDLTKDELAELCRLLNSARRVEHFEGRRSVSVELMTVDYGQVIVYDFANPGANLLLFAGRPEEETCTVRSSALGDFLAGLAAELAVETGGEPQGGTTK
jgi:hypothetical protein